MNGVEVHPTYEELVAFAQGRLVAGRQAAVERHIERCDACCESLRRLPEDTLVHVLRMKETSSEVPPRRAPVDAEMPPELAHHVRYRVIRMLGAGGMGVVYQAEHRMMERMVALKVINREFVAHPIAVERFRQEVRAAAKLSHPNIVAAHDAEQAGNLHFLVMEFVEGTTLAKLVAKRGPLPPHQACALIRQAALGLQHAHEQGMVHRDIKPQNLMLTKKGQLKILDFGLARMARAAEAASASLTQTGAVVGTPDYMAPEQALDSRTVDIRADIFSLGCALFFLLSGQVPFRGDSVIDKLLRRQDESINPVDDLRERIPPGVAAVLDRMMARDPARRYQTPAEVARALAPWAKNESASTLITPAPRSAIFAKSRWEGVLVGAVLAGLLGLGIAAAALSGMFRKNEPGTNQPGNAQNQTPSAATEKPPITTAARTPRVLILLPSRDFWYADYGPLRRVLERGGAQVRVASTASVAQHDPEGNGEDVNVNLLLGAARPEDFDAFILVGGKGVRQYLDAGSDPGPAQGFARAMRDADKPVAAICMASAVLADAMVLKDRNAVGHKFTQKVIEAKGGRWVDRPVVEDGRIITARDPQAAEAFAEAILRHLSPFPSD